MASINQEQESPCGTSHDRRLYFEKTKEDLTLLGLPVEIRHQIYDFLLVNRFGGERIPSSMKGTQKPVLLYRGYIPIYKSLQSVIPLLQACQKIYHEAITVLYSRNTFYIVVPEQMFRLMAHIRFSNIEHLRTLLVQVQYFSSVSEWLTLLSMLSETVTGLKSLEVRWSTKFNRPWDELERGATERGLGDNLLFVRALARIQGLEQLTIVGYYAKNWPAYLREKMGLQVRAIYGFSNDLSEDYLKSGKPLCFGDKKQLGVFTKYQQGTEDLIP